MTDGVSPITIDEHRRRIARAQELMAAEGLKAVVFSSGTSLRYFTGAEWGDSERFFGAVAAPRGRSGLGHARLRARAGPRADPDR